MSAKLAKLRGVTVGTLANPASLRLEELGTTRAVRSFEGFKRSFSRKKNALGLAVARLILPLRRRHCASVPELSRRA